MARGYNATVDVQCWKEHACCYCGASYRYPLNKKLTGYGATQTDAVHAARTAAVRSLRGTVHMVPCPTCGHYQPDMIGARRLRRHLAVFGATTAIFVLMFMLAVWEWMPAPAALWLTVVWAGAAAVTYTVVATRNPNASIRANKALAEQLVQAKQVQLIPREDDGTERRRPVVIETGVGVLCVLALLGLTVLLMPGSEYVRSANAWPWNSDWHPAIVGPGDRAWIWVQAEQPFESLRGEWRASGTAKIVQAGQAKLDKEIEVKVTSRTSLESDPRPTDARRSPRLWARLELPPHRDSLANRHVRIEGKLQVQCPDLGDGKVVPASHEVHFVAEVHLARPFAGHLYEFFWYLAMIGGGIMFLFAGAYHLLCDAALKRSAPPTRVSAATEEGTAETAAAPTVAPTVAPTAAPEKPA
jgi:hypothetical protein